MAKSLASKVGLKENSRALLIGASSEIAELLSANGTRFATSLSGSFTYIHEFFVSAAKLSDQVPVLKRHLVEGGALWISWPKANKLETDLSLQQVIAIGYEHGMVESKTISIDSSWSAIKFTFPKKGKKYCNSYGRLPSQGT